MKNTILPSNSDGNNNKPVLSSQNNIQTTLANQILYFRDLIQKTILSIQKYKQLDILGANELNQAKGSLTAKNEALKTANNRLFWMAGIILVLGIVIGLLLRFKVKL